MSLDLATMPDMGKVSSEPPPEPERKRPNRSGVPLHIYIPPDLRAVIEALADDGRRSITNEVIIALEEYAARQGRWPVKPAKKPKEA